MVSQIKVNEIIKQSGSSITIGESGDTITLPSSATLTNFPDNTPYFAVSNTAAQNLSDATWTKVTFNNEILDSGSNFADNKFTVPTTGVYHFDFSTTGRDTDNDVDVTLIQLYKNGSAVPNSQTYVEFDFGSGAGRNLAVSGNAILSLTANDYIESYVYVDSGGSPLTEKAYFSGHKLIT
jgi:hypothetical protein